MAASKGGGRERKRGSAGTRGRFPREETVNISQFSTRVKPVGFHPIWLEPVGYQPVKDGVSLKLFVAVCCVQFL